MACESEHATCHLCLNSNLSLLHHFPFPFPPSPSSSLLLARMTICKNDDGVRHPLYAALLEREHLLSRLHGAPWLAVAIARALFCTQGKSFSTSSFPLFVFADDFLCSHMHCSPCRYHFTHRPSLSPSVGARFFFLFCFRIHADFLHTVVLPRHYHRLDRLDRPARPQQRGQPSRRTHTMMRRGRGRP